MDLIGRTLGQYRIVEFIGAGGMASVYKAYQSSLDRYVAVKVLPAQHALTPGYKERFILEARAVAQLSHPNILPIYDFGLEEDLSYFVMKYVPGRTLSDVMGRPMKLDRVCHFLDQAAGALDHAHNRGILHRDIKPANMLLEGDWLLLADFGVAKITEQATVITSSGHVFGTPVYVSPEQAEGEPLDHHSDIYSLGVVLYEMVVGRAPFEDTTPMKVIFKHVYELPPAPRHFQPNLSEGIEQVILKSIAKKPADRYHCATDMATALREAIEIAATRSALIPVTQVAALNRPELPARNLSATAQLSTDEVTAHAAAAVSALNRQVISAEASSTSTPESAAPVSKVGMAVVALVLLLLLVGGFILFTNGLAPGETTPGQTSPAVSDNSHTPTNAVTVAPFPTTPIATPNPAPQTPIATTEPATPSPLSVASIRGILAIPVKLGPEFKVYVTGFDGAGMNGPAPVSLGNARQPMFRRDGQAIVVNGTSTGALRGIFVTDGQGQAPAPLNDRGDAYWPVWSLDGAEIMFVDLNSGRYLYRQYSQVAMSEADYSQVQVNNINLIANNILWSDDNRLVFQGCADWSGQSGECGIWVMDVDGLNPVRLTSNAGVPMDARQGWLTYMLAEDGDWEIYLLSLNGEQSLKLTDNNSQDGLPALAPDGRSVAYVSNESGNWAVWTITLSDRQKQKWFDLDPQRGTIDVNTWAEERMSWTR